MISVTDRLSGDMIVFTGIPPLARSLPLSMLKSMQALHPPEGRTTGHESALDTGSRLECRIVTDFAELGGLATTWERLWQSNPNREIFQHFNWARAWWQSFGSTLQLCVPVVYEGSEVRFILPLVHRRGELRFLGEPQYADMLCCHPLPERLLALALEALLRSATQWKECVLLGLQPDSQLARAWGGLPLRLRRSMQLAVTHGCPTILLGEKRDVTIDSLLAGKHMRRRLQKLQKAGVVTFRHVENQTEAQEQLTHFFRCHRRRCAALAKQSYFEEPELCSMVRALAGQLDLRREFRFGVLELNGRPLAWSLGFQSNGKYSYYQQTFDLDAEEYAPGEVLLYYLLSYARENVELEFDFLRGNEFFKQRFATQVNPLYTLFFQRPGIRGCLRGLRRAGQAKVHGVKTHCEGFIRAHENVFQLLRSTRTWSHRMGQRLRCAERIGKLTEYLFASCTDLLRRSVWSRREATLFQLENGKGHELLPDCPDSDTRISISTGRLGDLADLVREHPEIPFQGFPECRARLKRGDQVYCLRRNNSDTEVAVVAWTGLLPILKASNSAQASANTGDGVALALYECWPICNSGVECAQLMRLLTQEASKRKLNLLVCCPALPFVSRVKLESRGFLPKFRIVRRQILYWFRHDSIRVWRAEDEQFSAQDGLCPKLRKGQFWQSQERKPDQKYDAPVSRKLQG